MNKIVLQENMNAQAIADLIGGTLIMVNGNTAWIDGGDVSKLDVTL